MSRCLKTSSGHQDVRTSGHWNVDLSVLDRWWRGTGAGQKETLPTDASQMTDILDIESIFSRPWRVIIASLLLFFFLLFVIALLRALFRFFLRRRDQIQDERLSPSELFFLEVRRLEQQKLLDKGQMRKYYFFLSEAIRRYLGAEFGILALDQTTGEILFGLSSVARVPPNAREALGTFLSRADHVKFADLKPSPNEATADGESLVALVKNLSKG